MTNKKSFYKSIDTPAILLDLDKLEHNIDEMATLTKKAGLGIAPHGKCHKSPYICKLQMGKGAKGISISKLSEIEVLVCEGITNIEIVHPFIGDIKMRIFKEHLSNPKLELKVVVDMMGQVEELSKVGKAAGKDVNVLLKINTGLNRFGVLPGEPALKMAKKLLKIPFINLIGILAHESSFNERTAEGVSRLAFEHTAVVDKTASMLKKEGIPIKVVATGATPTAKSICHYASYFPEITEIHPGAYALGDWMYINAFSMTESDCAATMLTTVLSTTTPGMAAIDAGAKSVGVDPLGQISWKSDYLYMGAPSYGSIIGRPDIRLESLHEEIGILRMTDKDRTVNIGDKLEILPNHISFTIALHNKMYGIRGGKIEREIPILLQNRDY